MNEKTILLSSLLIAFLALLNLMICEVIRARNPKNGDFWVKVSLVVSSLFVLIGALFMSFGMVHNWGVYALLTLSMIFMGAFFIRENQRIPKSTQ